MVLRLAGPVRSILGAVLTLSLVGCGGSSSGQTEEGDALDIGEGSTGVELQDPAPVGTVMNLKIVGLSPRPSRAVRLVDLRPVVVNGCKVEARGGRLYDIDVSETGIVAFAGDLGASDIANFAPLPLDSVALDAGNAERYFAMAEVVALEPGRCEITGVDVIYEEGGESYVQRSPSGFIFQAS